MSMPTNRCFGLTALWSWLFLLWLGSNLMDSNRALWLAAVGVFALGATAARLILAKAGSRPPDAVVWIAASIACIFSLVLSMEVFQDIPLLVLSAAALGASTSVLQAAWDSYALSLPELPLENEYTASLVLLAALLPFLLLAGNSNSSEPLWPIMISSLPLVAAALLSFRGKKRGEHAKPLQPSPRIESAMPASRFAKRLFLTAVFSYALALAFGASAALLELGAYPDPHPALALMPGVTLTITFFVASRLITLKPATNDVLCAALLVGTVAELCLLAPNNRNTLFLSLVAALALWMLLGYLTVSACRHAPFSQALAVLGNASAFILLGSCIGIAAAFAVQGTPSGQQLLSLALIIAVVLIFVMRTKGDSSTKPSSETTAPAKQVGSARILAPAPTTPIPIISMLTPREREVVRYVQKGRSVPHICSALSISKSTAETHIRHIYEKTGVHSRQELLDILDEESAI